MKKIEFENVGYGHVLFRKLQKLMKCCTKKTGHPVEYKSSPYRVWWDYGMIGPNEFGTSTSGIILYFRDDEDYTLAMLMK